LIGWLAEVLPLPYAPPPPRPATWSLLSHHHPLQQSRIPSDANPECHEVLLYAIARCQSKYEFTLYGICIMSNHVHYLIEPVNPEDLPKIMDCLNWYTAMCFNRMLNRTGHCWEKRYHSTGFPKNDFRRALNTLRYIHANPKAAGMQTGFFYDFSNYGCYERLSNDGISQWHPAFLSLAASLEECAADYRCFCQNYRPKPKPEKHYFWGTKLLPKLKKGKQKKSPGQTRLPWAAWDGTNPEIRRVADQFIFANAYNPQAAAARNAG